METRFEFRDFLKVLGLSTGLFGCFIGAFALIPNAADTLEGLHPSLSFTIQYLIQFVVLFFPLWIFVVDKYDTRLKDFGFRKVKLGVLVKTVLLCYGGFILLTIAVASLLYYTGIELPGYADQESYLPIFGYDPLGLLTALLIVIGVAPFLEELFFRGFVYQVFTRTWPLWLGNILTAALFAVIHFQFQTFIPLFILGLFLNYAFRKTGSVWTSMAFHSLNNTIAFGLDYYLYLHPEILEQLETLPAFLYIF